MSRSERDRAWAAQLRKNARTHKHVCEWCPADDVYTCQKAPCQHLKKKPCPSHKWNAKHGLAPERMDFTSPTVAVTHAVIGEYADWPSNTWKIDGDELVPNV